MKGGTVSNLPVQVIRRLVQQGVILAHELAANALRWRLCFHYHFPRTTNSWFSAYERWESMFQLECDRLFISSASNYCDWTRRTVMRSREKSENRKHLPAQTRNFFWALLLKRQHASKARYCTSCSLCLKQSMGLISGSIPWENEQVGVRRRLVRYQNKVNRRLPPEDDARCVWETVSVRLRWNIHNKDSHFRYLEKVTTEHRERHQPTRQENAWFVVYARRVCNTFNRAMGCPYSLLFPLYSTVTQIHIRTGHCFHMK